MRQQGRAHPTILAANAAMQRVHTFRKEYHMKNPFKFLTSFRAPEGMGTTMKADGDESSHENAREYLREFTGSDPVEDDDHGMNAAKNSTSQTPESASSSKDGEGHSKDSNGSPGSHHSHAKPTDGDGEFVSDGEFHGKGSEASQTSQKDKIEQTTEDIMETDKSDVTNTQESKPEEAKKAASAGSSGHEAHARPEMDTPVASKLDETAQKARRNFYREVLKYENEEGPWVELKDVGVAFQKNQILNNINLHFEAGVTTAIVGPNGSGKSTLLKTILGQYFHTGEITMGWTSRKNTMVSYVPQHIDFDREIPMNGLDFLGMLLQKRPVVMGLEKRRKEIIKALLSKVNMDKKSLTKIGKLSGGELKRMLLIQALYPEPGLVLLDEPMAALDEPGIEIFNSILEDLQSMGKTIIWVEHDLMAVRERAHRLVAVNRRIIHEGKPSDLKDGDLLMKLFSHEGRKKADDDFEKGKS